MDLWTERRKNPPKSMPFLAKMVVKSPIPIGKRKDTKIIIWNMIKFTESQQFLLYIFYSYRVTSPYFNCKNNLL